MKRKHKMKKKQQRMKTLQFKRKRKKIKTTEVNMQTNMFRLLELRSRSFNKFSKREISGLKLKVMVVPCHKCFLTDKSATEGAGSHTTILRGEGARAH